MPAPGRSRTGLAVFTNSVQSQLTSEYEVSMRFYRYIPLILEERVLYCHSESLEIPFENDYFLLNLEPLIGNYVSKFLISIALYCSLDSSSKQKVPFFQQFQPVFLLVLYFVIVLLDHVDRPRGFTERCGRLRHGQKRICV